MTSVSGGPGASGMIRVVLQYLVGSAVKKVTGQGNGSDPVVTLSRPNCFRKL